jgi:membrane protein required for beta-lactamase induction
MRRLNGWLVVVWIVMIPVSLVFGLLSSVAFVSALSLWALVSGHWSGWQAARVEVTQDMEAKQREAEPIEAKVVEKLIHDTTVEASESHDDS